MIFALVAAGLWVAPGIAQESGMPPSEQSQQTGKPDEGKPDEKKQQKGPIKTPSVGTEIVIDGLTLKVDELRIGIALSPRQIEDLAKVLEGTGVIKNSNPDGEYPKKDDSESTGPDTEEMQPQP